MDEQGQKKILIIEDHRDMLAVLTKFLEEQNYIILGAESAETGLEIYSQNQPDLVLMDIMLPGMSGFEALQLIKESQNGSGKYIPVIMITARRDVSDIVSGLKNGADDYLVKPFNFEELDARITAALRLKDLNELLLNQSQALEDANNKISSLNDTLVNRNNELRKNIFSLHSLFEISMELSSILELEQLINAILLTLVGQYSCNSALFFFSKKERENRFEVIHFKGFSNEDITALNINKGDGLIKFLDGKPSPVLLRDMVTETGTTPGIEMLEKNQLEMVTPVKIKGQIKGVIGMGPRVRKEAYSEQDFEHISILSNFISIAITNASLYREVEQLSYTDGMTDLHNYRYFEFRLREEVIRHNRTGNDLSLLILDVDHFKNYNDTMGHQSGDKVLIKLGQILRDTVRENDIVARYGGEEFAIILPNVDAGGALILAERIREKVESHPFEHGEVQPLGRLTISLGIAGMTGTTDSHADLIRKADTALYASKRHGRNQVRIFEPGMSMEADK